MSGRKPVTIAGLSRRVAALLRTTGDKVVLAESCTGGLVSGALTRIPGISAHHCGGVIVYRNATKTEYLGIPAALLDHPGPVSSDVAQLMAESVLDKTPEATIAVSVTGHLGPKAPPLLDGRVFVGIVQRGRTSKVHPLRCRKGDSRSVRQQWVVARTLELLADALAKRGATATSSQA